MRAQVAARISEIEPQAAVDEGVDRAALDEWRIDRRNDAGFPGWQKVKLDGQVVYVALPDQRSLTWSSHDMVYTVMADAPAQTVDAVIGALPHDKPPGFFKRMSRGFVRLASWVNPFR